MDIYFSRNEDFKINFGNGSMEIDYDLKLKDFFINFHNKTFNNKRLSKKGYSESLKTKNGLYTLSYSDEEVYFYHGSKTKKLYGTDLWSIYNTMNLYLDEKYKDFLNNDFDCGGTFKVPSFYSNAK